jgi:transcriptional regulator with PAS, ATPase and Fis domain
LVARALYRQSPRANAPFIKVNCAAIPENLIESEFFGHEKGAFTGALTKREGRFELAHGGTILLDEISEISSTVQAKLLRILQERELERVGGNRTIKVDVRVIATTNRHLEESVSRKEFRQDLFFRLNVVPIMVAPLRERKEDIHLLADQFRQRFARKHGIEVHGISNTCNATLQKHDWPGNVRELQNVIERAVILCNEGGVLEPVHLGLGQSIALTTGSASAAPPLAAVGNSFQSGDSGDFPPLSEVEKRHILAALEQSKGNRTHAAKVLGISIRTLRNKLNEYNYRGEARE